VDLLIEKHGHLIGAFEIKAVNRVTGAHLSGLRAFREEYPEVPLHVISLVEHPYRLEKVLVMPWKQYLKQLMDI
jgi:hypothetical protein